MTRQMYIDAAWVPALDGQVYETVNPATEEPLGPVPHAGREDMLRAIAAARRAFDHGPWPTMPPRERYRIVHQIADLIEKHGDELSRVVMTETGVAGMLAEVSMPLTILRDSADLVLSQPFTESLPPSEFGGRLLQTQVLRVPVGVCGLLPTWNVPVTIAIRKIAPALAAGCTIVLKAPPQTPLTLLKLAEIIAESDLPPGVFNVLTGDGIEASEAMITSPDVDQISFTGGLESGRKIEALAAATLKRTTMELGGKSANIILDDVDLDAVAPMAALPVCFGTGQTCSMLSRVFVPRALQDKLAEKMAAIVSAQQIGDPFDPQTIVGPLIRAERRAAVEGYVQLGLNEGATLVTGGKRPAEMSRGYFYEPTIFTDVSNKMRIAREEIFGPVLVVIPYDTVDEAIAMANDNVYGLQANITCANVADGVRLAGRIRSAAVAINGAMDGVRAPRGGIKQSGFGREIGKWALDDYLQYQSVTWPI